MDKFLSKPLKLKTIKELVVAEEVLLQSSVLDATFLEQRELLSSISSEVIHEDISEHLSVSQTDESVAYHLTGPVCLIADGSKTICKSLEHAIEKKGYRISYIENGDDALRLLKIRNWDLVLLDQHMPLLSGSSCMARFRTWELRNRVVRQKNVYLISNASVDDKSMTFLGFDGALGKPVKLSILFDTLEKVKVNSECNPNEILLRY